MSGDNPSCWTCENRKARKQHKCCDCRGTIQVGETYQYFSGVWDEPAVYKTCSDCVAIRKIVDAEQPHDEPTPFEMLHETVFERRIESEVRTYIDTKIKRGAPVPEWMQKRYAELTGAPHPSRNP